MRKAKTLKAKVREMLNAGGADAVNFRHTTLHITLSDGGANFRDVYYDARYAVLVLTRGADSHIYDHRYFPTFDAAWQYYDAVTHGMPRMDTVYHFPAQSRMA